MILSLAMGYMLDSQSNVKTILCPLGNHVSLLEPYFEVELQQKTV